MTATVLKVDFAARAYWDEDKLDRLDNIKEAISAEFGGLFRSSKKGRRFRLRLVKPGPTVGSKQWHRQHSDSYLD